jgi:futalosine hydrolase
MPLLLIPTRFELERLQGPLSRRGGLPPGWTAHVCGFGQVAAAARTMQLLAQMPQMPVDQVLLVGIAGTLSPALAVGQAYWFDQVQQDGIGVGTPAAVGGGVDSFRPAADAAGNAAARAPDPAGAGSADVAAVDPAVDADVDDRSTYRSAAQLGWSHWDGPPAREPIGDCLALTGDDRPPPSCPAAGQLLSVCAASATPGEAQWRRRRYPNAAAEEMEGFGVALACRLAGVPLTIVRGISNVAGDRELAGWDVLSALDAVAEAIAPLLRLIASEDG